MTTRRSLHRRGQAPLLAEIGRAFSTVARPNLVVILWRWRYESMLLVGVPVGMIALVSGLGWFWSLSGIGALIAMFAAWPRARSWTIAHARCVITTHRVRTGCAQAWIHSRQGKLPIILFASPKPFGEQVHLWCRAGTSEEDFESVRDLLRSACWARAVRVSRSARYSHIVILDVIRGDSRPPLSPPDAAAAPRRAWESRERL